MEFEGQEGKLKKEWWKKTCRPAATKKYCKSKYEQETT